MFDPWLNQDIVFENFKTSDKSIIQEIDPLNILIKVAEGENFPSDKIISAIRQIGSENLKKIKQLETQEIPNILGK